MDFLSNLIKRPNSITLPVSSASNTATTTITTTTTATATTTETTIATVSVSTVTSVPSSHSQIHAEINMNQSAIDKDLKNLYDSVTQDLDRLEEKHMEFMEGCDESAELKSSSSNHAIKQLLNEINANLNQVPEYEKEHFKGARVELSPRVVKSSSMQSVQQQKALVAALHSTSQPPTPTTVSSEPLKMQNVEQLVPKFTGLPQFDETQIPELEPLSVEMEAQLKADECLTALSSTVLKLNEPEYNSDSELYAECLSLNSGRCSAEISGLETYSSALNEVLDQHFSNGTAATLESTLNQADAVLRSHNDSCEPMDVDDFNETMELLKEPEDRPLLEQPILSIAMNQQQNILQAELPKEDDHAQFIEETKREIKNIDQKLNELIDQQSIQQTNFISTLPTTSKLQTPKKSDDQKLGQQTAAVLESPPSTPTQTIKNEMAASLVTSPPIPTHRMKTAEEQELYMALQEYAQPPEVKELAEKQKETKLANIQTLPSILPEKREEEDSAQLAELIDALDKQEAPLMTPLQLSLSDLSQGCNTAPTSPSFPIKSPDVGHFPRSALAPPDNNEMPYLEQGIIEPSADHKLSIGGVIAKLPQSIQLTITESSPQKSKEQPQLDVTVALHSESPLNGSFDNVGSKDIDADQIPSRATFGVPLDAAKDRRTFSNDIDADQIPSRATFGVPLDAAKDCRTFSVVTATEQQEQDVIEDQHLKEEHALNATVSIDGESYGTSLDSIKNDDRRTFSITDTQSQEDHDKSAGRRTFSLEESQMRRTFCKEQIASPAMEATEENSTGDDFEPMDIDVSMRLDAAVATMPLSPPIPTHQHQKKLSLDSVQSGEFPPTPLSPPISTYQSCARLSPPISPRLNRPPIHDDSPDSRMQPKGPNATVVLEEQMLSAKEQLSASDEKDDVFVEHFGAISPISDDIFKAPQLINTKRKNVESAAGTAASMDQFNQTEFQDGAANNIILNSSDFDYLYTKGSNNVPIDRSSLLLKFDPLLGTPVPVNQSPHLQLQQEQALLNILSGNNNLTRALSPTLEEHETSGSNQSFVIEPSAKAATVEKDLQFKPPVDRTKKHAKMSVDVIGNDCNKTFENSNLNSEDKTNKYNNMDELEKKIQNEVTRSEDIEKKLKDAEQREEALVKRITEKDKTNSKLNGVIEAYEKAIAELIHDKEQLVQSHERQMQEVQTDRDANYHHLTSLETTFSDLHVKYEKSKEMTSHLKQIEDNLLEEKKKLMDKLRQQEQRYEQMKSHAMQQMEIANKKLATVTKEHADEVKKLKALLKKEEVSRISTAEQLQQKSRENADLLKICEELIYDKGQGGSS